MIYNWKLGNQKFFFVKDVKPVWCDDQTRKAVQSLLKAPKAKFKKSWKHSLNDMYRNDISIKSSNVKLNINDVCNLIRTLKGRSTPAFLIKELIKRKRSKLF